MAFAWGDFMKLAVSLEGRASNEAELRTAVSRAYYAVYHKARDRAPAHRVRIDDQSDLSQHNACWMAYMAMPAVARIGMDGDRLKKMRHEADYQIRPGTDWVKTARAAIEMAQDISKDLH